MTILLVTFVGCTTVSSGTPTEQRGPKDISFGDLFASDAGSGGSGGGSGDTDGSGGDSGSWDTGSWDTGGGGGGGSTSGSLYGTVEVMIGEFPCDGGIDVGWEGGTFAGTGTCSDGANDWDVLVGGSVDGTYADGTISVTLPGTDCITSYDGAASGTLEEGGSLYVSFVLDVSECGGEVFDATGTISF